MKKLIIFALCVMLVCSVVLVSACDTITESQCEHYYSDWIVVEYPTCTEDGTKEKRCALCDDVKTESIPKLGHDYQGGVCARCGAYNYDIVTLELMPDNSGYKLVAIKDKTLTTFTIPSTYNNKPVVAVSSTALEGFATLQSLTVPDSILQIDADTFANLKVTEVHVSSILQYSQIQFANYQANPLWKGAKLYYNSFIVVNLARLEGAVTIENYAFYGASTIKSISLPDTLQVVGEYAFANLTNLTAVTIPTSLKTIKAGAFSGCSKLITINYNGTKDEFLKIEFGQDWAKDTGDFNVTFQDGSTMSKAELLKVV